MADNQETITDIIAEKRRLADKIERACDARMGSGKATIDQFARELVADIRSEADRLEAALNREVDKLNSAIQATVGRSDAEIDRLRREIEEMRQAGDAAKLPDGWKMYDKYQIRHTDGTPLKGKRYFVLRLDSDDPLEAARVAAAMSAYKGETPQGDAAKLREALATIRKSLVAPYESEAGFMRYSPNRPLVDLIDAALAEPTRNCDKYANHNDAMKAFEAFVREQGKLGFINLYTESFKLIFAPATEKEGCAK